jgi:hypothetical protein
MNILHIVRTITLIYNICESYRYVWLAKDSDAVETCVWTEPGPCFSRRSFLPFQFITNFCRDLFKCLETPNFRSLHSVIFVFCCTKNKCSLMSLQNETFPVLYSRKGWTRFAEQRLTTLRDIERIMESKTIINFSADISVTARGSITFQSAVTLNNSN